MRIEDLEDRGSETRVAKQVDGNHGLFDLPFHRDEGDERNQGDAQGAQDRGAAPALLGAKARGVHQGGNADDEKRHTSRTSDGTCPCSAPGDVMPPGKTQLILMPRGFSSRAGDWDTPTTPDFAATYCVRHP